jgi:hypothetical protein
MIVLKNCTAYIKASSSKCGRPVVEGKAVCSRHGGMSTGPKTPEGRAKCAAAKTIHGQETRAIRAERQKTVARLRFLEDLMFQVGMIRGSRTRGRKPLLDGRPSDLPPLYRPSGSLD